MNARIQEIFAEAIKRSSLVDRVHYLDEACGDDRALRQEVESLLMAHFQAVGFLQNPIAASAAQKTLPILLLSETSGTRIGRYKLLERIGEGGFGVVWMAEQEEPVRRRVALKIIKLGMDTKEVVARFEAERQALALMDHPNIACVFDGGATDTGRPYFVMELVKGVPITDYCDANKLDTQQRLELFMQVCHAVQHAHQKGVIHRDLKPSNILVTVKDDQPVPKVIDFGVAKAMQARLTERTMFTQFRQLIGTPAYMSPEQAGLGSLDVDTRSDIYSLGVLLYELLTGKTPFDTQKLLEKGYDAVMRTIREDEPPKPSTRLSTLSQEELTTVAAKRGAEPGKLNRIVHGELDWIVMKALEKDRRRRYETPEALAADIGRHLADQPVTAMAPSAGYVLTKFIHRHRMGVITTAALALTVVCGTSVSVWQTIRANRQAALADLRSKEAEASQYAASDAQGRAERSARELSHQLARRFVDSGVKQLDEGDDFGSLVWFTEALKLDEGDSAAEQIHRLRIGTVLSECPKIQALFLHKDLVFDVELSPDGRRLLTASADKSAQIWDINTGEPVTPPLQHASGVVCASFGPDGRKVVTASFDDCTARVWDAKTGQALTPPMLHDSNIVSAAFSPDGQKVVTASFDNTARIWDASDGRPLTPPLRHQSVVWQAVFSPDGRTVLTASWDGSARIWESDTGQPLTPPLQHSGKVWWAAFSPNGEQVVTASDDHTARVWDAHSGAPLTSPLPHEGEVIYAAFSPDGQRVVTATGEPIMLFPFDFKDLPGAAQVWDVATGKPVTRPMRHDLGVYCAIFSPDGRQVATASRDKSARIWNAQTGEPLGGPLQHAGEVFRLAFSPDGRRLATASFDKAARVWDVGGEQPEPIQLKDSWLAGEFKLSPDGQLVAGKYIGNCARVWNALTGLPVTPRLHDTTLNDFAFSPDSRLIVTAGADHTARIWDARTGMASGPALRHSGKVYAVSFSPDSRLVVTASADHTAQIWEAITSKPVAPPMQHATNVLCAEFSPDGHFIATGTEDGTAQVWDASTGKKATPPMIHKSAVTQLLFSPDGSRLLAGCWDGSARIWNSTTGTLLTAPMKQGGRFGMLQGIESMAFSPDGQRVVIADSDKTARVWSASTGMPVTPPLRHAGVVACAAFSHNGRYVVTASTDQTARVWDADTGQPITPCLTHKGWVDFASFTPDDGALTTLCRTKQGGYVESWNLKADNRPGRELLRLAQLLSLHQLDTSGAFVRLDFENVTNRSWILQR